jgi:LAO/AO transport system kinase
LGTPSKHLVDEVLAGQTRAIARLITRAEAGDEECRPALAEIYRHAGSAHLVGITGVPGSGKSTLVSALAQKFLARGHKVAVVAMDPSSPFSGGSILGDRIRMNDIACDPRVFIRSMATRGALGGLARASLDAVDILDAGGFEVILIETVGVGQDEIDVVQAAYTTVVVSSPGLGDDIQAIKAGILEIADIHVVSKCDRSDANKTVNDLKQMLLLNTYSETNGSKWSIPVISTSATTGQGLDDLAEMIDRHRRYLTDTDEISARRQRMAETRTIKIAENIIRSKFAAQQRGTISKTLQRVIARQVDPHSAAIELLAVLNEGLDK